jgi:hypothetical protein
MEDLKDLSTQQADPSTPDTFQEKWPPLTGIAPFDP